MRRLILESIIRINKFKLLAKYLNIIMLFCIIMRKLSYELNWNHLQQAKEQIVPTLFTEHQFALIEKRTKKKKMTPSEKNEFSRTISRKMKAIYLLMNKTAADVYVYGKEKIIQKRREDAEKLLRKYAHQFKGKQVILTGSFLYSSRYNDIDIFVITEYEKEEYKINKIHINYLNPEARDTLFFSSISKLCISNKELYPKLPEEKGDHHKMISLYQELLNDLDQYPHAVKQTLREFLLLSSWILKSSVYDSQELKEMSDRIINCKKPKEIIKKIFIQTFTMGIKPRITEKSLGRMIQSYTELIKEYPNHRENYNFIINTFQEAIDLAS
jgi:predicted nucleotidyltransferase